MQPPQPQSPVSATKSRLGRVLVLVPSYTIIVFSTVAIVGSILTNLYGSMPAAQADPQALAAWCGDRLVTLHSDLEARARVTLDMGWEHNERSGAAALRAWDHWTEAWSRGLAQARERCVAAQDDATAATALSTAFRELATLRARYDNIMRQLEAARTGPRSQLRAALVQLMGEQQ